MDEAGESGASEGGAECGLETPVEAGHDCELLVGMQLQKKNEWSANRNNFRKSPRSNVKVLLGVRAEGGCKRREWFRRSARAHARSNAAEGKAKDEKSGCLGWGQT